MLQGRVENKVYGGMYPMNNNQMSAPYMSILSDMLIEAMKDERHDRAKYKMMMDMTKNDKIRRQIEFAYEDEGKHYEMFQQLLFQCTGRMVDIPVPEIKKCEKLIDAIESSIDGELEAVELYRKIHALLPTRSARDQLYEIITDEQEHATRFVYLYAIKD
jgi:rubrerythrin